MKIHTLALCVAASLSVPAMAQESSDEPVSAAEVRALLEQVDALKQRVAELEARAQASEERDQEQSEQQVVVVQDSADEPPEEVTTLSRREINSAALAARVDKLEQDLETAENAPINIGGAVRTQYVWQDYNEGNKDRGGDFDFDLLRLDYSGSIGDVILSAQYRWFEYMEAVQHAWVGYNFNEQWQGQVGITTVPFGTMPYNSNNYFFSSNFYIGLEDDHDTGLKMLYRADDWDLDIAFFKNDEQGGVDGAVRSRTDRYAYDPLGVRLDGEGIYSEPTLAVAESNSWALRGARKFNLGEEQSAELGLSGQWGSMHDGQDDVGDRMAWAAHGVYNIDRWTFMGQVAQYDYDMDMANDGIVVGAYAYYDTIPSEATMYTANVAYSMPVQIGPISNLTFYNDFSLMTDKRGYDEDTMMNVLGMAVTAGGLYTYFDLVTARNQPFIGGSMVGESEETNTRFNINIGYYF